MGRYISLLFLLSLTFSVNIHIDAEESLQNRYRQLSEQHRQEGILLASTPSVDDDTKAQYYKKYLSLYSQFMEEAVRSNDVLVETSCLTAIVGINNTARNYEGTTRESIAFLKRHGNASQLAPVSDSITFQAINEALVAMRKTLENEYYLQPAGGRIKIPLRNDLQESFADLAEICQVRSSSITAANLSGYKDKREGCTALADSCAGLCEITSDHFVFTERPNNTIESISKYCWFGYTMSSVACEYKILPNIARKIDNHIPAPGFFAARESPEYWLSWMQAINKMPNLSSVTSAFAVSQEEIQSQLINNESINGPMYYRLMDRGIFLTDNGMTNSLFIAQEKRNTHEQKVELTKIFMDFTKTQKSENSSLESEPVDIKSGLAYPYILTMAVAAVQDVASHEESKAFLNYIEGLNIEMISRRIPDQDKARLEFVIFSAAKSQGNLVLMSRMAKSLIKILPADDVRTHIIEDSIEDSGGSGQ